MKKGEKMSDEQKAKIAKANSGRKLTPEHIENLRKSHLGQIPTNLAQLRVSNLGRKRSEETRRRMSLAQRGKKQIYKSEESRRRGLSGLSGVNGNPPWNKDTKGLMPTPWNKDKKGLQSHTDEFKENRRQRWLGKNNPNFGKLHENHPVWKDVKKHPFTKMIREIAEYREWRTKIFNRDTFTCVECGISKVYIEADHYPKRFADILVEYKIETLEQALNCKELWDINNGRTLCRPCHNKTKGRYKKS